MSGIGGVGGLYADADEYSRMGGQVFRNAGLGKKGDILTYSCIKGEYVTRLVTYSGYINIPNNVLWAAVNGELRVYLPRNSSGS